MRRNGYHPAGVVYLLHFQTPYKHAAHYTGWTDDLEARLAAHTSGRGARLLEVITNAGITFQLARTWQGTRALERQLKKFGGARRQCPICTPGTRRGVCRTRTVRRSARQAAGLVS